MRRHTGSVLPKVAISRSADGFHLLADRPSAKAEIGQMAAVIFSLLLITAAAVLNQADLWTWATSILYFVVSGVFIAKGLIDHERRRALFGDATLIFPSWPLRLGDEMPVKFQKQTRRQMDVELVSARLECVERVTIGSGKSQRVEEQVRWRVDLGDSEWSACDATGSWTVSVPDVGPSFEVHRMKIEWNIVVATEGRGVPSTATFKLLVVPELAQ